MIHFDFKEHRPCILPAPANPFDESALHRRGMQARIDLAACYRLVHLYGMSDMMVNHISSRVPGEVGAFLINAYGMMYEEITAFSLIKVDHDGTILPKPDFGELDYGINKAGYVNHSALHEARPEVGCVIHTHNIGINAILNVNLNVL